MKRTEWTYLAQLARALQQECVDGRVAGDFLAEVDAHLAEVDVDPVDEFGPPAALAREVAGRGGSRTRWTIRSPWWAMAAGLVLLLLVVAVLEAAGAGWPGRVEIGAGPFVYGLTIYLLGVGFGFVATRRLDGRTWAPLIGWRAWVIVGAIAITATTLSTELQDRVVVTVAKTGIILGVAVALPVILGVLIVTYNPIRFPPHARHLRPLRRGLMADRFVAPPGPRSGEGSSS